MRIITVGTEWLTGVPHLTRAPGGGARRHVLGVQRGLVEGLPGNLAGLLVCSDLQAREDGGRQRLLGELVAETVAGLAGSGGVPSADRIGVLLAGDLYARLDPGRLGGLGDVSPVWRAFAKRFRWVAGVLGNHDLLDLTDSEGANAHLLDGNSVQLDGLTIGGVSGIIGDPKRTNRKTAQDFEDLLLDILAPPPDVVLLHQGPALPESGFYGSDEVGLALECAQKELVVVCGHVGWPTPLGQLANGVQVLNVDARIILLVDVAKMN